jgi:hypothetical protein
MSLVHNERFKLLASYMNGLAIASAAVGGIGQIVNDNLSWRSAAWIAVSLVLHGVGQLFIRRLHE